MPRADIRHLTAPLAAVFVIGGCSSARPAPQPPKEQAPKCPSKERLVVGDPAPHPELPGVEAVRYLAKAFAQRSDGLDTPALDSFTFASERLLWHESPADNRNGEDTEYDPDSSEDPNAGRLVLNAAVFPNGLGRVNVFGFGKDSVSKGQRRELGRIAPAAFAELGIERLARFLIMSETLETYIHIGSNLCFTAVAERSARLDGTHDLCTNECRSDPVSFRVEVSVDGMISVTNTGR